MIQTTLTTLSSVLENDRRKMRPEAFLIFSRSGLLMYGAFVGTTTTEAGVPVLGASMNRLTARVMLIAARRVAQNGYDTMSGSRRNGVLVQDAATDGAKLVLLRATAGCRVGSSGYAVSLGRYAFEYPLRMGLATLGLMVMVSANDLVVFYLALEWQSLCLYVLAAFRRGSAYSTEAGLKYFIMGAVASGFLLFGASRVYGATGTVHMGDLSRRRRGSGNEVNPMRAVGMVRMRSAVMFKLAVAPFHAWSPDVYEGSPSSSALYFSVVPKIAMVVLMIRLCVGPFAERWWVSQPIRWMGAMLSRTVSTFAARIQRRLKRFRAYSSIGHVGYILLGASTGSLEGVQSARLYAVIYVVMSLNVWLAMMSVARYVGEDSSESEAISAKYISDLGGLGYANPFLAATLSASVRSMAGIPPFAGFMAKMWVFLAAMGQSLVVFAVMAVLRSCVGAFYYRRWVKVMYFDKLQTVGAGRASSSVSRVPVDSATSLVRGTTLGRMLMILAVPGPVLLRTHRMALSRCR